MNNPFADADAARLYAQGRPFYHAEVLRRVARAHPAGVWQKALDVCCGTGLSTIALLPYAETIVGVDASEEMIRHAPRHLRITYHTAPAEALPFAEETLDLLSVCEAFHWLDQERFLTEARRVLQPDGHLLIYGGGFHGAMEGVPDFATWFKTAHMPRYPMPARGKSHLAPNAPGAGWQVVQTGTHEEAVPMTAQQLADYFLSVSNTLLYLKQSGVAPEAHREFLIAELLPFYKGDPETPCPLVFGGTYTLLTRT